MRSIFITFCLLGLFCQVQSEDDTKLDKIQSNEQQYEAIGFQNTNAQHFNPWQSVFSAANEAFKLYTKYGKFTQRSEIVDTDTTTEVPTTVEDTTKTEPTNKPRKSNHFVTFEAVPSQNDLDTKEIQIEYVPYNEDLLRFVENSTVTLTTLSGTSTISPRIATITSSSAKDEDNN